MRESGSASESSDESGAGVVNEAVDEGIHGADSIYLFLICRMACWMVYWRCEKERRGRAEASEDTSGLGDVNNRTIPLRKATMRYSVSRRNFISALKQWETMKVMR